MADMPNNKANVHKNIPQRKNSKNLGVQVKGLNPKRSVPKAEPEVQEAIPILQQPQEPQRSPTNKKEIERKYRPEKDLPVQVMNYKPPQTNKWDYPKPNYYVDTNMRPNPLDNYPQSSDLQLSNIHPQPDDD